MFASTMWPTETWILFKRHLILCRHMSEKLDSPVQTSRELDIADCTMGNCVSVPVKQSDQTTVGGKFPNSQTSRIFLPSVRT